jgi:hypothetical protein
MTSFPTHGGVAAPSGVSVIAVALHGLPLAPTELAAGLRLAGRAVGPAPTQMTSLGENQINYWIRSLTPKILRPTWGNKAKNIKAKKGGAKKKIEKKIKKKKKILKFNLNTSINLLQNFST